MSATAMKAGTRRLRDIAAAAQRIASGDLSARVRGGGRGSAARAARAFNDMAAAVAFRERTLRAADRGRRQMFAEVSHELNAPLTAMRGYLETLRTKDVLLDADRRDRYLATVERETRRLARIVADLRDLARYDDGGVRLRRRTFSTGRLFDHVVQRHDHEARRRGIRFFTSVDPAAGEIDGDPDRLEQAIDNLVANAVRHTAAGGLVEMHARPAVSGVYLIAIDSGPGIPADHVAHVFDRFYRIETSRDETSTRSGLGLAIAKAIVERHGGSIQVDSEPGRTEFTIWIPPGTR